MRINYFLLIAILLSCCSPPPTIVRISVTDKISEQALDSVQILLVREIQGQTPHSQASYYTNQEGKCRFTFEAQESYTYKVIATRQHFQETVSADGGEYENQAILEVADTNDLQLFLEAILPPDPERFTRMHDSIPVSQLLASILADEWSWAFLPRLSREHIPALLQMGNDTTYIHNYPHHPLSTYQPDSIRAGLVALWLIEAIRKAEIRGTDALNTLMPPSRAPTLGTRRGNPSGRNTPEQVQNAFEGYSQWWEQLQQPENGNTIRNNPLRGKGMSWM